jgi:hypothetical protein
MPAVDRKQLVARLRPKLQTHVGRDVYFCNDLVSGRLAILNLQYADSTSLCLPPARHVPLAGTSDPHLYTLTLQPAITSPASLRRHMEAYAKGGALTGADGMPDEFTLLRLRMGWCSRT